MNGSAIMQFTELSLEEFNDYTKQNFSHFTQTEQNYKLKKDSGIETYLVGVKDGDAVKAACLITLTPVMKVFNYAYTNRGPVLDYSDEAVRSEEHTSELQSRFDLVCRLLLEKKKGMAHD